MNALSPVQQKLKTEIADVIKVAHLENPDISCSDVVAVFSYMGGQYDALINEDSERELEGSDGEEGGESWKH